MLTSGSRAKKTQNYKIFYPFESKFLNKSSENFSSLMIVVILKSDIIFKSLIWLVAEPCNQGKMKLQGFPRERCNMYKSRICPLPIPGKQVVGQVFLIQVQGDSILDVLHLSVLNLVLYSRHSEYQETSSVMFPGCLQASQLPQYQRPKIKWVNEIMG